MVTVYLIYDVAKTTVIAEVELHIPAIRSESGQLIMYILVLSSDHYKSGFPIWNQVTVA